MAPTINSPGQKYWLVLASLFLVYSSGVLADDPTTTTSQLASTTTTSTGVSSQSASTSSAFPSLSTSPSSTYAGLANAPTIAGSNAAAPSLIVPDTSAAPFMKKSSLPEGTVFICVGAVLGFLGAAILLWRGVVAWSLQRSVQQADSSHYTSDAKSMGTYRASNAGMTSHYDSQDMSLDRLAGQNTAYTGSVMPPVGDRPKAGKRRGGDRTPTTSSLFFSPTAGTVPAIGTSPNRSSSYLPAGYYAAGQSAPNAGAAVSQIGGAPMAGYNRGESDNYSPPLTPHRVRPSDAARRDTHNGGGNLRVGNPTGDRTPSVYLNELFENHGFGPRERFHD